MRAVCRIAKSSSSLLTPGRNATAAAKIRPRPAIAALSQAATTRSPRHFSAATRLDHGSATLGQQRHQSQSQRGLATEARPLAKEPTPLVHDVFEKKTGSWQYVVADPATLRAIMIDPVLDYDAATATLSTTTADSLLSIVADMGYTVDMILETHAHADHITAASYLQSRLAEQQAERPLIGIGRRIAQVQSTFSQKYNIDSRQFEGVFDKFFDDDEVFQVGSLNAMALYVPGHTPDHMAYRIGEGNVFTGDSIFHADLGTARADFPGGDAAALFASGRKLLSLPGHVTVWSGHDYPPEGRAAPMSRMTVAEHRARNKHLHDAIEEEDFVALRKQRDATLSEPKLLHPSLQMNLRAGKLPEPTPVGNRLLSVPLKIGQLEW